MPSPNIPAGWYSSPDGAGTRYWDGTAWTPHLHPASTPPPSQTASASGPSIFERLTQHGLLLPALAGGGLLVVLLLFALTVVRGGGDDKWIDAVENRMSNDCGVTDSFGFRFDKAYIVPNEDMVDNFGDNPTDDYHYVYVPMDSTTAGDTSHILFEVSHEDGSGNVIRTVDGAELFTGTMCIGSDKTLNY